MTNSFKGFMAIAFSAFTLTACGNDGKEVASTTAVAIPTSQALNWQKGIEYDYFADGSCKSDATTKCLDVSQYEAACKSATGISQEGLGKIAIISTSDDAALIRNGTLGNLSAHWDSSNRCSVSFTAEGIIDGNSKRSSFFGNANQFSAANDGGVLINNVDVNH